MRFFFRFILVCMFARRAKWNGKLFRCHRMEEGRLGNWNRNLIVTKFNYFTVTNWKINFDYLTSLHSKIYVFLINGVKNYWKIRFDNRPAAFLNDIWFAAKFDIRHFFNLMKFSPDERNLWQRFTMISHSHFHLQFNFEHKFHFHLSGNKDSKRSTSIPNYSLGITF